MDSALYFSLPLPSWSVARSRFQHRKASTAEEQEDAYDAEDGKKRKKRKRSDGADQEGDDDARHRVWHSTYPRVSSGRIQDEQAPDARSSPPSSWPASAASLNYSSKEEDATTPGPSSAGPKTQHKIKTRHLSTQNYNPKYRSTSSTISQDSLHQALANLSPPLLLPALPSIASKDQPSSNDPPEPISQRTRNLRRHHLSVLTTLLHRCLLDGDYDRAGRAWALLLRTNVPGGHIELRAQGRWGTGAEVLLQQLQQQQQQRGDDTQGSALNDEEDGEGNEEENGEDEQPHAVARERLYGQRFGEAKEYYERLILQYASSHRGTRDQQKKANALDFHLALFGLWIYSVQEQQQHQRDLRQQQQQQHKRRRRREQGRDDDDAFLSSSRSNTDERSMGPNNEDEESSEEDTLQTEAHQRQFLLQEAQSIGARMDELMLSPPYSDSAEMWHLRGMVALWTANLCYAPDEYNTTNLADDDEENPEYVARAARRTKAREERQRAKNAFRKVLAAGGKVWEGVKAFLRDDDEEEQEGEEAGS